MRRVSTVRRGVVVGAMAMTAVLAVPAAAGVGGGGPVVVSGGTAAAVVRVAAQPGVEQDTAEGTAEGTAADTVRSAVDRTAAGATALAGLPGYAGVAVDYETATVTVSWKGAVPPPVVGLRRQAPDGVRVDVRRAALSEAELRAASTRLLDSQRAEHGPDAVLAAFPAPDFTGLVAEIRQDSAVARRSDLAEHLGRAAGVPVRTTLIADGVESTAGSRRDDHAPWHAGGAIATADGTDYCTTGFSVVTGEGHHRIVSAAHCNDRVGDVVRDGMGHRLGTVTHRALGLDAQLIDPVGDPETAASVFGGPWDARPGGHTFPVTTVQRPAVGQNICSSGAVTGEHCATIRATDIAWTCGSTTCHGFRASRDDGGVVVGGGDSGGPMYIVIGGEAYARGMIDGGSNRRSCGRTSLPTQCFTYVYGIPMVDILEHWGARIDT
ncbi:S1 family peptidase [Promicromonospora thailandica]|uniref:Peptidase S1 domain-containing protein n=1 Tax=Promicromonospora thailandica TaxID=765201 RepID=A0A9X2FYP4_9MICO|nr:S1 family peptidase [Promicromonospora thailandica]MCP2263800.1 hypothetical protein [Promicromonospora thailandica]BFF17911.1 hypothetical protein GCM10025730_14320 [Promicromonospora thailandica]